MKILTLLLCLLLNLPAYADGIFFAPYVSAKAQVISLISNAKQSIRLAMYALNDPDIVSAIITQKVDTEIILDYSQSQLPKQKASIARLKSAGIPVLIGKSRDNQLIHVKMLIIDNTIVAEGSYNYSIQAQKQDNTLCVLTDKNIASQFMGFYELIKKDLR